MKKKEKIAFKGKKGCVSFHALLLDACIEDAILAVVKEIKSPNINAASEMQSGNR